ncbi:MAG: divergent polysaccharide deacetylase family protein [Kiloniellales bacterium]|nr:divergent polysaccharide deacetylase family protein [Kiloniellales bacterium]
MARLQDDAPPGGKGGLAALIAAWIVLFALVGAGFAWVFYLHPEARRDHRAEQAEEKDAPAPGVPRPAAGETAAGAPPAAPPAPRAEAEPSPEELKKRLQKQGSGKGPPTWRRFAAAFDRKDPRPRIAIVITGLGLDGAATQRAVQSLPAAVTLSFTPYASDLNRWIAVARVDGHEVMLDLPMEPLDFPRSDPGPLALMTGAGDRENLERLNDILGRGSNYIGVAAALGSRFAASEPDMRILLRALKTKGLIYLDNASARDSIAAELAASLGTAWVVNDRLLDDNQASDAVIRARLAEVESLALARGQAVAIARPYPQAVEQLARWARDLGARGFALAPVSALVPQPGPA